MAGLLLDRTPTPHHRNHADNATAFWPCDRLVHLVPSVCPMGFQRVDGGFIFHSSIHYFRQTFGREILRLRLAAMVAAATEEDDDPRFSKRWWIGEAGVGGPVG